MSDDVACWCMVLVTLVGGCVSVMWLELLMMLKIRVLL